MSCPFCNIANFLYKGEVCFAAYDGYPVSEGHMLIVPIRHFANYFDATDEEKRALFKMVDVAKNHLDSKYHPDGYNIGINIGEAAGQTVGHLHIHLIPRYKGDMDNPRGGVRGVIPEKRLY